MVPWNPESLGEMALEHPRPLLTSSNRPGGPAPLSVPPSRTVTHPEETMSMKVPSCLPRKPLVPSARDRPTPSGVPRRRGAVCPGQRGIAYQLHYLDMLEHGDKK